MSKEKLYELVEALPENKVETAADFLGYLLDKEHSRNILSVLEKAPEEREMPDAEELKAIKEAEEDIVMGRIRPYSELKKELGS
ncbi:hypothetical protein A2V82_07795 [candidate division KSB1 bacterium RBG_16_48_16]|nr:MAG: hypothetical protein A2V82_07795 [candidate division KSB1 bacterium RBG_16_48_16]